MNHRFFTKYILLFLCISTNYFASAQESEINANNLATYNHAVELYNNKAYSLAQKGFKEAAKKDSNTPDLKLDSDYYAAMCAIKLNQTGADKMVLDFVKNYPNSNKREKAFLNVGNYYFANNKVSSALKWYSKVNPNILSVEDRQELDFKMAYSLLVTGNLDKAKGRFLSLIYNAKYGNQSKYYYGFIAYKQEDYDTAETYLTKIADKKAYQKKVTYYLLDIDFKASKFEKCIENGGKLLVKSTRKEKSEISKIVGESYFNLKKYAEAIPYLTAYIGKRKRWNNTDYYQLGYAYYKQNDFENAVKNFNKIIGGENSISQNAYYHLAECYLSIEKKTEALLAFKSASEMDFDLKIKEDSSLNYARLSYEEGNPYESVAEVLQNFLTEYPKSPHYQEINNLVVNSFLYQQDYQGALDYLSKKISKENEELYKNVSFYRAVQLFNQNKLQDSYVFFKNATESSDKITSASAIFWKAETDFLLSNFRKALNGFVRFRKVRSASKTEEFKRIDYNIAYSYFKLKNYTDAAKFFRYFVLKNTDDTALNDDANIRLADCYFVTKDYTNAIIAYNKVVVNKGVGADYAHYQKAISYGFIGQNDKKIDNLLAVVNNYSRTSLRDDALFQLANTYVSIKNNKKAHKTFDRLLNKHTRSSYVPKALLRQGLLYYNENENQKSLEKYKKIVSKYSNTDEAKQAVTNARNVYIDMDAVDEYATWVKNIRFVNVTDADLDNTTYEAAENRFLENNTEKAIEGFTKYITRFPEGLHSLKANFYLAQSLDKINKSEKAMIYYKSVVDKNQSEFSEESLNKLAQIYLEKEDWSSAIPLLIRLEEEANYPQNILFAQSNLMKGYYQSNKFENAVSYAEKVLSKDKLDEALKSDAKIIIARSAFKTGNLVAAKEYYTEVEKTANGELKAEALYYNAFFKNKNKEFEESNKVIQQLIADYSTYKYWGVKSYIIMAKNHYELKDVYQATYILENIIKNFTQFEDIISDAQKELERIKNKEAKTNDSVTPQN